MPDLDEMARLIRHAPASERAGSPARRANALKHNKVTIEQLSEATDRAGLYLSPKQLKAFFASTTIAPDLEWGATPVVTFRRILTCLWQYDFGGGATDPDRRGAY
jgi:hypothetical protein